MADFFNDLGTSLSGILSGSTMRSAYDQLSPGSENFDAMRDTFIDLYDYENYLNREAAKDQNEFNQSSADKAMQFEADQAALNRDFQQASADKAMQFEADQAALNRQFQADMSNTAYQRAVADLRAAGLNPALAYQQGGAAAVSGATASGQAAGGSSASGRAASGQKANTSFDLLDTTLDLGKDLLSLGVNSGVDLAKTFIPNFNSILGSVSNFFKFVKK